MREYLEAQEIHVLDSGQSLYTHSWDQCQGQWCAIHNRMPGPWSSWPMSWRADRGIMERTCPCGVGHPVAEMYEYCLAQDHGFMLTHGCCGRCPCAPVDPDATQLIPVYDGSTDDLHKRLLDTVIDLWPASPRATVVLRPEKWEALRNLLLETGDHLNKNRRV